MGSCGENLNLWLSKMLQVCSIHSTKANVPTKSIGLIAMSVFFLFVIVHFVYIVLFQTLCNGAVQIKVGTNSTMFSLLMLRKLKPLFAFFLNIYCSINPLF